MNCAFCSSRSKWWVCSCTPSYMKWVSTWPGIFTKELLAKVVKEQIKSFSKNHYLGEMIIDNYKNCKLEQIDVNTTIHLTVLSIIRNTEELV